MSRRCNRGGWLVGLGLVCLTGLLAACGSAPAPAPAAPIVRITAPASTLPMLHDLAASYQQQTGTSPVVFDLQAASSQLAHDALQAGEIDLAASSWLTSTDLPGLVITPFAWDAVAVVIHPRNPITDITLLQLRDVYRGHTLDWITLGGRAGDITVISREDGAGLRAAFEQAVMGDQPVTLGAVVMPTDAAVIDFVMTRPAAIGYVSQLGLHAAGQHQELPAQVKTLPVEGVVPDSSDLLGRGYHLVHPLYLLARQPMSASLQSFVEFVLSPAGQAVVARHTTGVRRAT